MTARVALTLAYHGGDFQGWQVQEVPAGSVVREQRTVQGVLEAALEKLVGQPTRVHGSGRTDAGVHAEGQTAHFDVPEARADLPWRNALNALLPPDVAVLDARTVPPDFHARFSAVSKTYRYRLWLTPGYVLPQRKPFVWSVARHGARFDLEAVADGLARFRGRHDFAAFQNVGTPVSSTVREVLETGLRRVEPHEAELTFAADGFLKQMVRNMVGCLAEIGRGRLRPEAVSALLAGGRRAAAPATAPARGLTLWRVDYGSAFGPSSPGPNPASERRPRQAL